MMIKIGVNGQKLRIDPYAFVVGGSSRYLEARVSFSPDWNSAVSKRIIFERNDGETFYFLLDSQNRVTADKHMDLESGRYKVSVYGVGADGLSITTNSEYIEVHEHGRTSGDEPTAKEIELIDQISYVAAEARDIAQSVRDDANAGLFKGDKGDPGLTPHIGDNGNWFYGDEDSGIPAGAAGIKTDHTLSYTNGVLSVNTANAPEADNTLPITAAAVNTVVGNIETLLNKI